MQGLMQHGALTLDKIIDHAAMWHGGREVVSRSVEGPIVRTTYGQIRDRAKRVSNALLGMGIKSGDRVGTLAWNTGRHMEAWYGIMGIGAVCHTLNPRLFPEQIAWIADHAGDRAIFTDLTFLPIIAAILPRLPHVEYVVVFTDRAHMPADFAPAGDAPHFKGLLCYEELVEQHHADCAWGGFDEGTAAGLCYTSGTTGDPKGVMYSHRSNFLHTLITLQPDVMGLSQKDVILPVVPMFHANAWGVAFSAPGSGAKMVMPGAKMDGASIYELLDSEQVTFSAAVPTVWQMLLQHLEATGATLPTLKKVVIGGAACPESIIRAFHDKYDVEVVHAWGMTETSPVGTLSVLTDELSKLPYDQQMHWRLKQGRPPLGVEIDLDRLASVGRRQGRLGRGRTGLQRRLRQLVAVVGQALADQLLVDLAGGAQRDVVDDQHVVGHPPLGDLALQIVDELLRRGGLALLELDQQHRALVPLGMGLTDHRRQGDLGMAHGDVLDLDGRDPLAARLDHVLGAVGDLHEAVLVDRGDVAGVEEALVVQDLAAGAPEVLGRDDRTADLQVAEGLAVVRQALVLVVLQADRSDFSQICFIVPADLSNVLAPKPAPWAGRYDRRPLPRRRMLAKMSGR